MAPQNAPTGSFQPAGRARFPYPATCLVGVDVVGCSTAPRHERVRSSPRALLPASHLQAANGRHPSDVILNHGDVHAQISGKPVFRPSTISYEGDGDRLLSSSMGFNRASSPTSQSFKQSKPPSTKDMRNCNSELELVAALYVPHPISQIQRLWAAARVGTKRSKPQTETKSPEALWGHHPPPAR
jgi:hypothetical protein